MTDAAVDFDRTTVDRLLTTTKSVRRRLDLERPVEPEVIEECLQLAVHAPSANNTQNWRFVVVTEPDLRREVAEHYRVAWRVHSAAIGAGTVRRSAAARAAHRRTLESSQWLVEHLDEVPAFVIPCVVGRPPTDQQASSIEQIWQADFGDAVGDTPDARADVLRPAIFYGSIFPAIWSFQLALRSRGLGSVITMVHLPFERDVASLLGIPRLVTQIALLPVAYTKGTGFQPPARRPAAALTYWNRWDRTRARSVEIDNASPPSPIGSAVASTSGVSS